jgi:hypothetical protein
MDHIEKEDGSRTINTLSARLELYVDKTHWEGATRLTQDLLKSFILYCKESLESKTINMMNTRFQMIKNKDIDTLNRTL